MWIWRLVVLGLVFGSIAPMGVFAQTPMGDWVLRDERKFGECSLSQTDNELKLRIAGSRRYPTTKDSYPRIVAAPNGKAKYSIDGGPEIEATRYHYTNLLTVPNTLEELKQGKRLDVVFTTNKGEVYEESFNLTRLSELIEIFEEPRCLASLTSDWRIENRIAVAGAWGVFLYSTRCYIEQVKDEHRIKVRTRRGDPPKAAKEYEFFTGHGYTSDFRIDDGPLFDMAFSEDRDASIISGLTVEMLKRGATLLVREPGNLSSDSTVEVLFDLEGFGQALAALAPCKKMFDEARQG